MPDERKEDKLTRWLTVAQVLKLVPVSRRALLYMEKIGRFPKSYYLTPQRHYWRESDITAWQKSVPAEARFAKRGRPKGSRNRKKR